MSQCLEFFLLQQHSLFDKLTESQINDLCSIVQLKKFVKDEMIYSPSEEINHVYTLHQGRVKVGFYHEKNVEVVVEILKENDIYGNLELEKAVNSNFEFAQVLSD